MIFIGVILNALLISSLSNTLLQMDSRDAASRPNTSLHFITPHYTHDIK